MRARSIVFAVLGAALTLTAAPGGARAQAEGAPAREPGVDRTKAMWRYEIGYRGAFVASAGYDPFSNNDYFPQLSMTASRTVYAWGPWSFAPGLSWDYGKTGASARGSPSSLEVHRLTVPLEGRLHFGPWGYAFVRGAPGVALESAEIDDPSAPAALTKNAWLLATDLSAGYAYPFVSRPDTSAPVVRVWVQADGGYGWVQDHHLALSPALPAGDPRIVDGIDLGTLALRGPFFRLQVAASF